MWSFSPGIGCKPGRKSTLEKQKGCWLPRSDGVKFFAIAPLISIEGNIMFLGSGESDCLDFNGDPVEPAVAAATLAAAIPGFLRLQIRSDSRPSTFVSCRTVTRLQHDFRGKSKINATASRIRLFGSGTIAGPEAVLELTGAAEAALESEFEVLPIKSVEAAPVAKRTFGASGTAGIASPASGSMEFTASELPLGSDASIVTTAEVPDPPPITSASCTM